MKARRFPILLCLLPTLLILLTGCATHRPRISTWNDSQFTLTRGDTIALTLQLNPSPENVELGRLLTAGLKQEGFKLVPVEKADYLMAYTVEDELVDQGRSVTTIEPASPPQTAWQMIGQSATGGYSSDSTFPARTVSRPVVYRNRGIRLFLYNNPKTRPGGFRIIWQGYIAIGHTPSAEREAALIRTLLGYLGREYHGSVELAE